MLKLWTSFYKIIFWIKYDFISDAPEHDHLLALDLWNLKCLLSFLAFSWLLLTVKRWELRWHSEEGETGHTCCSEDEASTNLATGAPGIIFGLFLALLTGQLERRLEMGREKRGMTCSKRPQVGLEPAAVRTKDEDFHKVGVQLECFP